MDLRRSIGLSSLLVLVPFSGCTSQGEVATSQPIGATPHGGAGGKAGHGGYDEGYAGLGGEGAGDDEIDEDDDDEISFSNGGAGGEAGAGGSSAGQGGAGAAGASGAGLAGAASVSPGEMACEALGGNVCAPTGSTMCAGETALGDAPGCAVCCKKPIKYVIVLVKENHTFDNYFTGFPGVLTSPPATVTEGGKTYKRQPMKAMTTACDPPHSHNWAVAAYNAGKMNQFVTPHPSVTSGTNTCRRDHPEVIFGYYTEKQLPNYWQYARNFVLFDRYFSTILGQSGAGHLVTVAAQSPMLDNPKDPQTGCPPHSNQKNVSVYDAKTGDIATKKCANFPIKSIVDILPTGMTWAVYGGSSPVGMTSSKVGDGYDEYKKHMRSLDGFVADFAKYDQTPESPKQPNLIYINSWGTYKGTYGKGWNASEHPAGPEKDGKPVPGHGNPCAGENLSVELINAIMQGKNWKETAIVLTYDDWGGFYDHVKPTVEDHPKQKDQRNRFYSTGFRLPAMIISPYAKKGMVNHTPTEQASIPKLIEELWGMKTLADYDDDARDKKAGSMMSAFDFKQAPRAPFLLKVHACE